MAHRRPPDCDREQKSRPEASLPSGTPVPNELSVALTLRDERMKKSASVRADYTAVVDGDRRYVEVSDTLCQRAGYRREELLGRRFDDLTAPGTNDIPSVYRLFVSQGDMQGLWTLASRTGATILVRYESWVRSDCYIQGNMEVLILVPVFFVLMKERALRRGTLGREAESEV